MIELGSLIGVLLLGINLVALGFAGVRLASPSLPGGLERA